MSAFIDENTQFVDASGKPIVNGKIYIGVNGSDPVLNPITIFSDRELTIPLANPQLLDANGRSTNKIWIPSIYSFRVDNSNDVQQLIDLDAGEAVLTGVTTLSDVQGINAITAVADPAITSYVDGRLYIFTNASTNTGPVTLSIDGLSADPIVKNRNQPILDGEMEATQTIAVIRNETNLNFEWINQNNKVLDFYEGTPIVSAATTNIWSAEGNTVHITGTAACNSFGTAPNVGARRRLIYDDVVTLTNSANLHLQGEEDFTTEAGDILDVYADTLTQFDVIIHRINGETIFKRRLVQSVNTQTGAVASGTSQIPIDNTIPQNTEGTEFMTLSITPTNAANILVVDCIAILGNTTSSRIMSGALFQDATVDAIASCIDTVTSSNNNDVTTFILRHRLVAGTISSTTFKFRAGANGTGTTRLNGINGALHGGVLASSITIKEIQV